MYQNIGCGSDPHCNLLFVFLERLWFTLLPETLEHCHLFEQRGANAFYAGADLLLQLCAQKQLPLLEHFVARERGRLPESTLLGPSKKVQILWENHFHGKLAYCVIGSRRRAGLVCLLMLGGQTRQKYREYQIVGSSFWDFISTENQYPAGQTKVKKYQTYN